MKTKLLKKVRKRFAIIKCCEIASDASSDEREYVKKFGLPFYYITDKKKDDCWFLWYHWPNRAFSSYKEALNEIIHTVHYYYFERIKHKNARTVKVWSINNKKQKKYVAITKIFNIWKTM